MILIEKSKYKEIKTKTYFNNKVKTKRNLLKVVRMMTTMTMMVTGMMMVMTLTLLMLVVMPMVPATMTTR